MDKYKLKDFAKWAKKEKISDAELLRVVDEMNKGLLGDRLGAYIFKKRIGFAGRGKRGGARSILLFKDGELALFLYGYAKNEKSNLEVREEIALRTFAKDFMKLSKAERQRQVKVGNLVLIEE